MKNIVFLEYAFMFDPSETWSNLYQFENALTKFFSNTGLEVVNIKGVSGQSGRRILLIQKKPDIQVMPKKNDRVGRPPSIGRMMRDIAPEKRVRAAERDFKNRAK